MKPLQDKSNRDQPSFWVTVGGEVEENESVEDALQRELREEVGIINPVEFELVAFGEQILPWKGFYANPPKMLRTRYQIIPCKNRPLVRAYVDNFRLANRFKLTPCSAACMARERCSTGGIRTLNSPL